MPPPHWSMPRQPMESTVGTHSSPSSSLSTPPRLVQTSPLALALEISTPSSDGRAVLPKPPEDHTHSTSSISSYPTQLSTISESPTTPQAGSVARPRRPSISARLETEQTRLKAEPSQQLDPAPQGPPEEATGAALTSDSLALVYRAPSAPGKAQLRRKAPIGGRRSRSVPTSTTPPPLPPLFGFQSTAESSQ